MYAENHIVPYKGGWGVVKASANKKKGPIALFRTLRDAVYAAQLRLKHEGILYFVKSRAGSWRYRKTPVYNTPEINFHICYLDIGDRVRFEKIYLAVRKVVH